MGKVRIEGSRARKTSSRICISSHPTGSSSVSSSITCQVALRTSSWASFWAQRVPELTEIWWQTQLFRGSLPRDTVETGLKLRFIQTVLPHGQLGRTVFLNKHIHHHVVQNCFSKGTWNMALTPLPLSMQNALHKKHQCDSGRSLEEIRSAPDSRLVLGFSSKHQGQAGKAITQILQQNKFSITAPTKTVAWAVRKLKLAAVLMPMPLVTKKLKSWNQMDSDGMVAATAASKRI